MSDDDIAAKIISIAEAMSPPPGQRVNHQTGVEYINKAALHVADLMAREIMCSPHGTMQEKMQMMRDSGERVMQICDRMTLPECVAQLMKTIMDS